MRLLSLLRRHRLLRELTDAGMGPGFTARGPGGALGGGCPRQRAVGETLSAMPAYWYASRTLLFQQSLRNFRALLWYCAQAGSPDRRAHGQRCAFLGHYASRFLCGHSMARPVDELPRPAGRPGRAARQRAPDFVILHEVGITIDPRSAARGTAERRCSDEHGTQFLFDDDCLPGDSTGICHPVPRGGCAVRSRARPPLHQADLSRVWRSACTPTRRRRS